MVFALVLVGPAGAALPSGDEFDGTVLTGWSTMEGDVASGASTVSVANGALTITSARASWVRAERAFYLWKPVSGDFVVTTRIRVHGEAAATPTADWSLAGLLVRRAPAAGSRDENWLGWTTGGVAGTQVFERKTTRHAVSVLDLLPAQTSWLELRLARVGPRFLLLHRYDAGVWRLDYAYWRPDLPATLQAGIDAQSGWQDTKADLVADVDFVHFAATGIPARVRARFVEGKTTPSAILRYVTRG
jgi:hypothetical protein